MKNWSVDIKKLKKDKEKYIVWRLEQMINFGLENQRLPRRELKNQWDKLEIDPYKKRFLEIILYGKRNYHSLSK